MCLSDYAIGMMSGVSRRLVSVPQAAYAELAKANPYRIALVVSAAGSAASVTGGPRLSPSAPSGSAMVLNSTFGMYVWNVRDHGAIVTESWGAFGASGGATVYDVVESLIVEPFRKWFDEALNKLTHGGRAAFLDAFNRPGALEPVPNVIPGTMPWPRK